MNPAPGRPAPRALAALALAALALAVMPACLILPANREVVAGRGSIPLLDLAFLAPATDTPRVQEMHILAAHIICELVEDAVAAEEQKAP